MKKSILFVAAIAAFSFTSFKKDRTCTCINTTTTSGGIVTTSTDITTYKKVKKSEVKSFGGCVSTSHTSANGTTYQSDCTLK